MGNAYDNASLIVTPNAYKASKIYALKPTDGSGDLAFSRAGSKMVRNSSGLWETIATNIPPLHYPVGGGCPSWLFEAEAENKAWWSADFSNGVWAAAKTASAVTSPIQGQAVTKITTAAVPFSGVIQNVSGASETWAVQIIAKKIDLDYIGIIDVAGGGVVGWFNIGNGTLGTINSGYSGTIEPDYNGFYRITLTRTGAAQTLSFVQFMMTNTDAVSTGAVGDTLLAYAGVELNKASSPIITAGSAVTRFADVPTTKNISLGVDEGSFYFQLKEKPSAQPDYNGISENSAINGSGKNILCYDGGIYHNLGGGFNALAGIANNDKVCIFWNSTTLWVSKNGATAATFNKTGITFNPLFWNQCRVGANIVGTILYNDAIFYTACLSITEANNLTA